LSIDQCIPFSTVTVDDEMRDAAMGNAHIITNCDAVSWIFRKRLRQRRRAGIVTESLTALTESDKVGCQRPIHDPVSFP
jgi:hypothetical protein